MPQFAKRFRFDLPDSFGCSLTQLRANPDAWPLAISVFTFKLFAALVAGSAISLPIRQRLNERSRRRAAQSVAAG